MSDSKEKPEGRDEWLQKLIDCASLEVRLRGLTVEERLRGLTAEERLRALRQEPVVRAIPDEILRNLSDDFIQSLSADV